VVSNQTADAEPDWRKAACFKSEICGRDLSSDYRPLIADTRLWPAWWL
jgi:hypothetical protein